MKCLRFISVGRLLFDMFICNMDIVGTSDEKFLFICEELQISQLEWPNIPPI